MNVDVVVVGGGPAGLSAALFLGRCRRRTVVLDHGRYRNQGALAVFGLLSRDGEAPGEIRRRAHEQLARYPVEIRRSEARDVRAEAGRFLIRLADGASLEARKLVLAAGVQDNLPPIPGLRSMWGRSAFLCPFCHAFEFSDRPLGVLGDGPNMALSLRQWSDDVVIFSRNLTRDQSARLRSNGVTVIPTPVTRLIGDNGCLRQVGLENGTTIARRAVFLALGPPTLPPLAEQLGLQIAGEGLAHAQHRTSQPGVFLCGDLGRSDLRFAVTAAADGAAAAVAAHRELLADEGRSL